MNPQFADCSVLLSSGPSELDLSLLGETSSLADVACKYDEVRLQLIGRERSCDIFCMCFLMPYFEEENTEGRYANTHFQKLNCRIVAQSI